MKGDLTVVGDRGSVQVTVTGLDVVGMPEKVPTLIKKSGEARQLAQTLLDAAREAE
jgi:hypothetical protein